MISVSDLPALNASLNFTAAVLIGSGIYFIRRGKKQAHKVCMIAALAVSTLFLTSYLIYHYHAGSVPFRQQGWIRPLYFFILITHVTLAAIILPMVLRTAYLAFGGRFSKHTRIARWTYPLWMYVSITGVVVYIMLYQLPLFRVASAHFALIQPASAVAAEDGGKGAPPCGEGPASNIVTPVQGGHPLKVRLSEFVFHPGHYRIALSVHSRDELPPDPDVVVKDGLSVSAAIQDPPQIPVVADGVFRHTDYANPIDWETDVALPNIDCERCTLQIIEFMAEHDFNPGGGFFYHHCADLRITSDPSLPPPDSGWTRDPIGPSSTSTQYFAQFAAGGGLSSSIVLANPSSTTTASGSIYFLNDEGRLVAVPVNGASPANTLPFTIRPLGSVTFAADAATAGVSGSATIVSNVRLAGAVKLSSSDIGATAIGESIPLTAALTRIVRIASRGVNTGIAIRNPQATALAVNLYFLPLDPRTPPGVATPFVGPVSVAPNGHMAKFMDELFPDAPAVDLDGILMAQSLTPRGQLSLTAIEIGKAPGEFAILPVTAVAPAAQDQELIFPQISNGAASASIWLLNPLKTETAGEVHFFDDSGDTSGGAPFRLGPFGGAVIAPPPGKDGADFTWARATANSSILGVGALGGSVVFTHPQSGFAAIGPASSGTAFIVPVSRKAKNSLNTGLAIVSLGSPITLSLTLRNKTGDLESGGQTTLTLLANTHLARLLDELFPNAFTGDFEGALTITTDGGKIAVTALQIGARGELAQLPVAPLQ